jgi:ABC-type sugar transport system ATPase subunit
MSQLQINNLYKTYDKTFALQDISFEVEKNDFIILLGFGSENPPY